MDELETDKTQWKISIFSQKVIFPTVACIWLCPFVCLNIKNKSICFIGETGLLVSKITRIAPFLGYAGNPELTERKKLHDVFQKGDLYLNSGDLLRIDHDNFIYFQDRIGETFRYFCIVWLHSAYFYTRCLWNCIGEYITVQCITIIITCSYCKNK